MKIRPKYNIIKAATGVKFSSANAGGKNWREQVFNNYRQHLLDQLLKYGEAEDYGNWLNEMQHRHSQLWNQANQSGNWEDVAYESEDVGKYQQDYRGGLGNDGTYQRHGSIHLNDSDKYDFNQTGIKTNQNTRYNINNPPSRTSGDYSRDGYDYKIDNLYSAITDDRRLLGRKGDWDENSEEFGNWQRDLNSRGWEMYLDKSEDGGDDYYKLRRISVTSTNPSETNPSKTRIGGVPVGEHKDNYGFDWSKITEGLKQQLPGLISAGRLAGTLAANNKIYDAKLKGISPNLQQSYNTYRQVLGDEATKQAYYRRAAQGQTYAAKPFTSDADKQVAYMMEAKRVGDELRAQGDLADNQEIRRTSDESNQHQWANTQRATEVANKNLIELNQANAARQDIIAQKYGADWSSIDNYLGGIESRARQKQAEDKAIDDQIFTLQESNMLSEDKEYLSAYQEYKNIIKKHTDTNGNVDYDNDEVLEAIKKLKTARTNATVRSYKRRKEYNNGWSLFAKEGTKITHKKKDDLLYKQTKDTVEHFRKMSKMSDDSTRKNRTKAIKLTPHPGGKKARKMQQGGVAPFMVYKPVAVGGETTTSTQAGGSSKSSSKSEDKFKNLRDLFKELLGKGIPIDVSTSMKEMENFFQKAQLFGEDLDSSDIESMYIRQLNKLNTIMFNNEQFKQAQKIATENDAINEFAVNSSGQLVVQNTETGKLGYKKLEDLGENDNPLTNGQLLNLRAYNPSLAFNSGIFNDVSNGIGINKIAEYVKSILPKIGNSEHTIEGYTKKDSNLIKQGIQILAQAPEGDYKFTEYTKNLKPEEQIQTNAALNYISKMLPRNMKTILDIHAKMEKTTSKGLLGSLIASGIDTSQKYEISAVTGKASKENKDSIEKVSSNPLLAMQREIGGIPMNYQLVTRDSNTRLSVNGTYYSSIPKVKEDMSIDQMLTTSGIPISSKHGITLGDQQINPENLKDIMYANNGGIIVTLPCKVVNGYKQVNLDVKDAYERAEKRALEKVSDRTSPQYPIVLGEELKNEHLDSLLTADGKPNKNMFAQFLVVEGYTSDKIKFDTNSQYLEKVNNPDEELEQRLIKALSTDKKKPEYSLDVKDHMILFEGSWDDIYRSSIFIPLSNNPNAAINNWGGSVNVGQQTELEELYQISNKSTNFNNNNTLE